MQREFDTTFALMFVVMLTIAAANTALQSVLPALGRSPGVADSAVAAAFSISALLWVIAAPLWANQSDRYGRRTMILVGLGGLSVSLALCGVFLAAGINGWIGGTAAFVLFTAGASLAVGAPAQGPVAGKVTSINGASFVLGPSIGVGLYELSHPLPYLVAGAACVVLFAGCRVTLREPDAHDVAAFDDPVA